MGKRIIDYDANFWKLEYEYLRRRTNKEYQELMSLYQIFAKSTIDLLHYYGMSDEDIIKYYKLRKEEYEGS